MRSLRLKGHGPEFVRIVAGAGVVLALAWGGSGCSGRPDATVRHDPSAPTRARSEVRVGLKVGVDRISLIARQSWRTRGLEGTAGPLFVEAVGESLIVVQAGRRRAERAEEIVLRPATPERGAWRVEGDLFAGDLIVRRRGPGALNLINALPIELYLRGVVPWEIGRPGPDALEAVKAQAVAARTYTHSHLGRQAAEGFDLYADTRDQVYRGLSGTATICDRAIEETAYEVAVYQGRLIRAYYHSTSGGHTATLTDVWEREGAPYLQGHRDADANGRSWSADSPHFRWTEVWSAKELGEIIRAQLPAVLDTTLGPREIGVLEGVEVAERDPSGRVRRLRIRTDRAVFEVVGDPIRWVLRPVESRIPILKSTLFELEEIRRDGRLVGLVARGGGFGHGVGLCQTGALARARAGQDYRTILRAYYPGIDIVDVRTLGSPPPAR